MLRARPPPARRPTDPLTTSAPAADRLALPPPEDARLTVLRKSAFGMGDFTVNTVLGALNMVFVTYFLIQVAGLRPELAGLVQLIGRTVDAFTDPAMGRLSDACRWRWGRRRPFFVLGALPFGASFALMWIDVSGWTQLEMFAYYTTLYVVLSVAMTVLSVPYLALQPELASGYDARTSLNAYRNFGSVLGTFAAAVGFRPVAELFGGGPGGFALAGLAYGVLMALPWFGVYAATWERPDYQRRGVQLGFVDGVRLLARHRSFRQLTGMYLCGRISMDIIGAMLLIYFTFVLGRSEDFEIAMACFIGAVLVALPLWLLVAHRFEKSTLFVIGSAWWLTSFLALFFAEPGWPRWLALVIAPLGGIGFAMVDLMPWSMLGEVVDEDDLASGERREGVYNGFFMFLRKLGGSVAVWLVTLLLGAFGFAKGEAPDAATLEAIRWITALGPALFLAASIWIARGYPLSRGVHSAILERLAARERAA